LAFIKALSAGDISPDFFKHLMAAMGKKKRPAVPTRNRGTTVPQRASPTGKRKATELACASDCSEPATRSPATGAGPASQQLQSLDATGEQVATSTRVLRGRVDIRGCGGRACRPVHSKWTAQAFSQGFGPVLTCCFLRDSPRAHVWRHVRASERYA
jgi:hypothetical protein